MNHSLKRRIPELHFFTQFFQANYSRFRGSEREYETGQLALQFIPELELRNPILNFVVNKQLEFSNFRIKPLLINMVYPLVGNNKQKSHQTERTQCANPVINQRFFPDQKTANQQTQSNNSNQTGKKTYIQRMHFRENTALAC